MVGKRPVSAGRKTLAARCTPSCMGTGTFRRLKISSVVADAARLMPISAMSFRKRTRFPNTYPPHDPVSGRIAHGPQRGGQFHAWLAEVTQLPYYVPSNWRL